MRVNVHTKQTTWTKGDTKIKADGSRTIAKTINNMEGLWVVWHALLLAVVFCDW